LIYLDSAATAQKPRQVIEEVSRFLSEDYANIHRGRYTLSERSEELYREARKEVATLLNARDDEVVFTASSTDSSNKLIQSLILAGKLRSGDKVLLG
jgi:cysteine desulfurase/selenocysteine lyase